jgi:hypothetical protein
MMVPGSSFLVRPWFFVLGALIVRTIKPTDGHKHENQRSGD